MSGGPRAGRGKMPTLQSIHTVAFDFDGVFTDNKVWVDQDGCESVRCDRGDGLGFDFVRLYKSRGKLDAEFIILSKEKNPVVAARAAKLKLACHQGIGDKVGFMESYLRGRLGDAKDHFRGLIYVGNDLNDVSLMRRAGFSVAPSDAHPMVRGLADMVLDQPGGQGFVRAFIERWLGITKLSLEEVDELVSHS